MIRPPCLQKGDTIGITCPARKIAGDEIQFAVHLLESWGLKVMIGKTVGLSFNQYGGTDAERKADLQSMLNNLGGQSDPVCAGWLWYRAHYG